MGSGRASELSVVTRQLRIMQYLAARCPVDLEKALSDLGITRRELNRFIRQIVMCGLPPYLPHDLADVWIEDRKIHCSFPPGMKLQTRLTPDEVAALRIAATELLAEEGTPYADSVRRFLEKLDRPGAASTVSRVSRHKGVSERITLLHEAMAKKQVLVLEYYTGRTDTISEREIRPYGVAQRGGTWYLVAWCEKNREVRTFRIDRILGAGRAGRSFEPPAKVNWKQQLSDGPYKPSKSDAEVHLKLSSRIAHMADGWSHGGTTSLADDGSVEVKFRSSNPGSVARWVLSLGPDAEVVSPEPYRKAVTELCDRLLEA